MSWISQTAFYLRSLFSRQKLDAQMTEEMRIHLLMETEAKIAAGMSSSEAREAALREFGNVASVQERTREEHGWTWLEHFIKDFRFVFRSLRCSPGFSATVVITLAVGTASILAVYSLVAFILFKAPPFPDPDRLVRIEKLGETGSAQLGCFSSEFQAFETQTQLFSEIAATEQRSQNVVVNDSLVRAFVVAVSPDFFRTFGIVPTLGREFRAEEFSGEGANVVMVTDQFWREKLGASPNVPGQNIFLDGRPFEVVGVLPHGQIFPDGMVSDIYYPLVLKFHAEQPLGTWLMVIGRLRAGVSKEQALAALSTVKPQGLPPWADNMARQKTVFGPLLLPDVRPYWLLLAGGLLLYASACINATNLVLARLVGRQRELAVRAALGGGRWRIARLVLFENLALSLGAGLLVMVSWHWCFPPIAQLLYGTASVTFDEGAWSVSSFDLIGSIAPSVLAGCAVAAVSMWRVFKQEPNVLLKEGGGGSRESQAIARVRGGLVVLQAVFAVLLLVASGLMFRSFEKVQHVNLGFEPEGLVKVYLEFPLDYRISGEAKQQLIDRIAQQLALQPGVERVACGQQALLDGDWGAQPLLMPDGAKYNVVTRFLGPHFSEVAGLKLVQGRWFSDKPGDPQGPAEVVINETMARLLFGRRSPIGEIIPKLSFIIVGVVHDIKGSLREPVGMNVYGPAWKSPQNITSIIFRVKNVPAAEFAGVVQRLVYHIDPRLSAATTTVWASIENQMWAERFAFSMLKVLTPVGLGLSVIGLFSIMLYNVEARQKEFGVRLALGATSRNLSVLVLKRGMTLAAFGLVVGSAVAGVFTRLMQSLLFETESYDPLVYGTVALCLFSAAAIACWLPARRAARVDPIISLRAE